MTPTHKMHVRPYCVVSYKAWEMGKVGMGLGFGTAQWTEREMDRNSQQQLQERVKKYIERRRKTKHPIAYKSSSN
jgi:hypothetical protein